MKHLFIPLVLPSLLSGCVTVPYDDLYDPYDIYASAPYAGTPVYAGGAPLHTASGVPVYAGPPPAYIGPPVFFGFGLHHWSHHHHHGHWRDGRGGWGRPGPSSHR